MKRILIILAVAFAAVTSVANEAAQSVKYDIPYDGVNFAEVDGIVYSIEDWSDYAEIVDFTDSVTDIVISEQVTIGGKVYKVMSGLSKLPICNYIGIFPLYDGEFQNGNHTLRSIDTGHITDVNEWFFKNYTALEVVRMPNVINIGLDAFRGCRSIQSLDLPKVESLGRSCFRDCTSLKDCSVPMVKYMEQYVFMNCKSLERLVFEAQDINVKHNEYSGAIGGTIFGLPDDAPYYYGIFAGCTSLREITVKGKLKQSLMLESSDCYAGLMRDGQDGCTSLEHLYVNNDMHYAQNTIVNAPGLKSITIGNNCISHLEHNAITGCDIREIHCMFPIPPARYYLNDEPIEVDKRTCVVYVPKGCRDRYVKADYWSGFANIVEDEDVEPVIDPAISLTERIGADENGVYSYYPVGRDGEVAVGLSSYRYIGLNSVGKPLFCNYSRNYNTDYYLFTFDHPAGVAELDGHDYAITEIAPYTAYGIVELAKVKIREGITHIGDFAFADAKIHGDPYHLYEDIENDDYGAQTAIALPSTLQCIGEYVFDNASLDTDCDLICYAMTPPTLANNRFFTSRNVRNKITLYVPAEAVAAYESAPVWSDFRIMAVGSVAKIKADVADGEVEYYNLQGIRMTPDRAGIYIRRAGGEVTKVMVR